MPRGQKNDIYGRNAGNYRVLDALATLAFDYPRRSAFFRGELKQFLLLARELRLSPLAAKGSFAGAMGVPQFMPGSYRTYAVDFDGDGRPDLWQSSADIVGSVANYLALLENDPARHAAEQTNLFAAMDHAHRKGDLDAMLRIERLLSVL